MKDALAATGAQVMSVAPAPTETRPRETAAPVTIAVRESSGATSASQPLDRTRALEVADCDIDEPGQPCRQHEQDARSQEEAGQPIRPGD